jgi:antirestriction protein ArdC
LENQIAGALETEVHTTLATLSKQFPIQEGLPELLAYLNIAARNGNRHFFDPAEDDLITLDAEKEQFADGPRIFFVKHE